MWLGKKDGVLIQESGINALALRSRAHPRARGGTVATPAYRVMGSSSSARLEHRPLYQAVHGEDLWYASNAGLAKLSEAFTTSEEYDLVVARPRIGLWIDTVLLSK